MSKRTAAVIPALNEEQSVASVVAGIRDMVDDVIVVDDGSTDQTSLFAEQAGAHVVRHDRNRGVGAAVSSGLTAALDRGATHIVQLDGDGQHDAAYVPALFAELDRGNDLVVGTRFELGFAMSGLRRLATRLFALLIRLIIRQKVTDPTSGFRAFSERAARELAPDFPTPYLSDTIEVLLIARERGLTLSTVPVKMCVRNTGQSSADLTQSVGYAMRILRILGRHLVGGFRR